MGDVLDLFDAREKAALIWVVVGVLTVLVVIPALRRDVLGLVKLVASPTLWFPFVVAAAAYVATVVAALAWAGIWDTDLTDVTVFWFFGAGVVACADAGMRAGDPHLLRDILRRNVRWVVLVEFLANLYVFPLWAELVVVPIVAALAMLSAVSETEPEFALAKRLFDGLMIAFALVLLVRAVVLAVDDLEGFLTWENGLRLALPPALTIALLPVVYAVAVYALYQSAFGRLDFLAVDPVVSRFGKWATLRAFHLNRLRLSEFSGRGIVELAHATDRDEVREVISRFRALPV